VKVALLKVAAVPEQQSGWPVTAGLFIGIVVQRLPGSERHLQEN